MIVQFGPNRLRAGSAEVSIVRQTLRTRGNTLGDTAYGEDQTWRLKIWLMSQQKTSQAAIADIKAQTVALENVFAAENQTLRLTDDSGNDTAHVLDTTKTEGGVRIIERLSYRDGKGVQGVTYRTAQITLRATVFDKLSGLEALGILAFQEDLQWEPAGFLMGHVQTLRGAPVKQLLYEQTPAKCQQIGSAVGIKDWPNIPPPIWPFALKTGRPWFWKGHPKRRGSAYSEYPIRWRYSFEHARPLQGSPHIWGVTYV